MSDSWSSDDAASPVRAPGMRLASPTGAAELSKQRSKPPYSSSEKTNNSKSRTSPSALHTKSPASDHDTEVQASPPSVVIRTDASLQKSSGISLFGESGSKKKGKQTVLEQSSSSDWNSSDGDVDSRLAAALQKKFDKHKVQGLNKFLEKKTVTATSPDVLQVTTKPSSTPAAVSVPAAAARSQRSISDAAATGSPTPATTHSPQVNPGDAAQSIDRIASSQLSIVDAKAARSTGSSSSDWDDTDVEPAAAASPVADTPPEAATSAASNMSAAAVNPPVPARSSQFTRRAMGMGGLSPRAAAAPHASPRFNPSLSSRAADGRLVISNVTDSSSSSDEEVTLRAAKVLEQAASVLSDPQRGIEVKSATLSKKHADPAPKPSLVSHAAASIPVSNPGAIISRQSSVAEEYEQQQHVNRLKSEQIQTPTAAAVSVFAAATSANGSPASNVEPRDYGEPSLPEAHHTRCSRLIGVPLAFGLTGVCFGIVLIIMGIVCFSSKGDVCGPLGSSWGTVALVAFGIFLLLAFTGLLKSAYRIYRERWNFYKLQRYEAQQQHAEQEGPRSAAGGRVPLDGMYFDSNQFFGNMQRTQGGGRALAPVQDDEMNAGSSRPEGDRSARLTAIREVDTVDSGSSPKVAAASTLVGVGMGGRGVRVGGGIRADRGKL